MSHYPLKRRKLLVTLCALFIFISDQAGAQLASQYVFSASTGTYTNISSGTAVAGLQVDDATSSGIPIGFAFQYCGLSYTAVTVSSNGWLSFLPSTAASYYNNDLELANIVPAVLPFWDDLHGGAGLAFYQTTGNAPNRVFTFEWRDWQRYPISTGPSISFQCKLYECDNKIQFIYRQEANNANVFNATIGITKTTTEYLNLSDASAAPVPSSTTYYFNLIRPATDQVYTFSPPPYIPTATGAGNYCQGETVTLTGSAPGIINPSYLWKKPDGTYDPNQTIILSPAQPGQSGVYQFYVVYTKCPGNPPDTSAVKTVPVNINALPGKPLVASVIVYCQGDVFDSIPIYGKGLKWYPVPVGGIPVLFSPVINTSQASTQTFYVSQTINNCEGPRTPVTINVAPKPAPPQVVTPVKYCQGIDGVPLVANGQNIRWYSIPSGGVGTPVTPTPTTNAQGTFTWYATQTVAGCESQRVPIVVTVSYIPNALITIDKPYVCQYETMTLTYFGNAKPDADYIWTLPKGASIVSGVGQGPLVVRFDSAGNHIVRLTVDNNGCVGPEATIEIPVRLSPVFSLDLAENACKGDIVNIAVNYSTNGIDKYEWYGFAGGEEVYGSPTKGPYGIRWNTAGVKILQVQATDDLCKSLPFFDTIDVHDLPDASITISKNNICTGDTVEFRGVYEQGSSYQWEPYQFFGESHSYVDSGTVDFSRYITLNVTNRFNCTASDSILINAKPCCDIYFPNAFTPNNDGRNDVFRAITVGTHQISTFRIQNRWGQLVFETGDEYTGWDGSFNGKPQDMGTYFYYIKYKCSDGNFYEDKGELILVR